MKISEEKDFWIFVDAEPLFTCYEDGDQVDKLVREFVKKYPEENLTVEYMATFNNCGDAYCINFNYCAKDKRLEIKNIYGEYSALDMCPECEEGFEPLVFLEDFEEEKTYTCPYCGAEISLNAHKEIKKIKLEDL